MKTSAFFFLFCVVGILVDSAFLWGEYLIYNGMANGLSKQQLFQNLITPAWFIMGSFILGAVAFAYISLKS